MKPKIVKHEASLNQQLKNDIHLQPKDKKMKTKKKLQQENQGVVSHEMSSKIMRMVKEQQLEVNQELNPSLVETKISMTAENNSSDDEDDSNDYVEGEGVDYENDDELEMDQIYSSLQITDQDLSVFDKLESFSLANPNILSSATNLAEVTAQEERQEEINPKVIEVYEKVGLILSRYKSGPLPKPFKIIPTLRDWTHILALTSPQNWSSQSMFEATRLFTSNLTSKKAQIFITNILLPRIKDEIAEKGKLDVHLYNVRFIITSVDQKIAL